MRGTIEGGLWALVVGTAGLGVASVVAPLPERAAIDVPVPVPVAEMAAVVAAPATPLIVVTPDPAPIVATAPEPALPAPAGVPVPAVIDDVPPQVVSDVPALVATPQISAVPVLPKADQPPLIFGAASAPVAPTPTQLPVIDTTPAGPPPAPIAEPVVEVEAAVEPVPVVIAEPEPAPTPTPVQPSPEPLLEIDTAEAPVVVETPAPVIATPSAEPEIETTQAPAVRINRPTTQTTETAGQDAEVVDPDVELDEGTALANYAAPFENPDALPLIAIVLIDDGAIDDAADLIAELGFAPTIAIDALAADAAARMSAFRAAGAEVAMQIRLPEGAQPTDVEVAFAAAFGMMPQVAMLFSDGTGVLQNSRSVTGQVMNVLAADGHGFVTVQRGLGNAARAADQADVPNATVLRDLDGNGESASAMARSLDQAAFRARQSGDAVLMARLTPQSLDVLRNWAQGAIADGVAPAPVSAILLQEADG